MTTKCKIILKYGLDGTTNRKSRSIKFLPTIGIEITRLLNELGLKQTVAGKFKQKKEGTWCSDEVNLEVAEKKLPEILRIFAKPRSVADTKGELDHLFLYIERL
jgi:hypothetical protein